MLCIDCTALEHSVRLIRDNILPFIQLDTGNVVNLDIYRGSAFSFIHTRNNTYETKQKNK